MDSMHAHLVIWGPTIHPIMFLELNDCMMVFFLWLVMSGSVCATISLGTCYLPPAQGQSGLLSPTLIGQNE
ncbi:hypothetical protein KY284_003109 [Solanum tuberosum]|nr:hypothetical protein KY284_003109 [Solanum tuberosum]